MGTIQNTECYAASNVTALTKLPVFSGIVLTKGPGNFEVTPGGVKTIVLTCENKGSVSYSDLTFYDSIDARTKFVDGSVTINSAPAIPGQYKYEKNILTVMPGFNVNPGDTLIVTFQVEIPAT